jgi:hypothetical protein
VSDDVVGSRGAWVGGDTDDTLRIGQPLEGARERGGDAQLNRAVDFVADPDGIGHRRHAVLGGSPDVGLVVGIRRREAVLEVARTCGGRLLDMPRGRHPDPAAFEFLGFERGDDLERIRKWRNEVGSRHRTDFQRRHAERQQLTDDLHLAVGGQALGGELKSIAQGHIA